MWRYEEVLPGAPPITLGEGMTPLIHAGRLGERIGLAQLYIKDEGLNPTASFKARGLSAAVTMAKALGATTIALPTAGNAGGAAAAYAAKAGLRLRHRDAVRYAHREHRRIPRVRRRRAAHRRPDLRLRQVHRASTPPKHGWFEVSTLKEPYRIEGKKTMGYELWEEFDGTLPDVIVYPTGGGVGLIGMWKAFEELEAMGLIGSRAPTDDRRPGGRLRADRPGVRAAPRARSRSRTRRRSPPACACRKPLGDFLILADLYASGGEAVAVDGPRNARSVSRHGPHWKASSRRPKAAPGSSAIRRSSSHDRQDCCAARYGGAVQHRQRLQVPRGLADRFGELT